MGESSTITKEDGASVPNAQLNDSAVREFVINRFDNSRQASNLDFNRFARYYKLFRNTQITKNYVGLANLFVPEPYRIIRKKSAKLANAIKNIKVKPENNESVQAAKDATIMLNFLRNKLGWAIQEKLAIQESRITGMAWLKVLWNLDKEEQDKPYKGFDVTFDTVDHVLLPADATIQQIFDGTLKGVIHYYESDINTLKNNPKFDKLKIAILERRSGQTRPDSNVLTQSRLMYQQSQRAYQAIKSKKFPVYEFFGKYPVQVDDGEGNKVWHEYDRRIVIVDRNVVVLNEDNPLIEILDNGIPLIPIVANIVGQETYPIGDIEPAESLFNELNDTRNQRMDTVTLNIDPAKEILRGANIDEKDLVARRGWVIKSNIPNGVRFISPDMQGVRSAIEEEKAIRGDIAQVTGTIDFAPGSDVQAGVSIDTAKGTVIAKGEADVLTEDELNMLKFSLRMFYRVVLAYSQVFLDRAFAVQVTKDGQDSFQNMSSENIRGNLDLDIEMQTLQDKTTEQQLKLMLFNQAKTVPGANMGKFFADMLEAFKEDVNVQEYYSEPQPQAPEPPKVSISLKGDLTGLQAAEVYKTIPGVDPLYGDPALTQEGRQLIKGIHPEDAEHEKNKLSNAGAVKNLTAPVAPPQEAGV